MCKFREQACLQICGAAKNKLAELVLAPRSCTAVGPGCQCRGDTCAPAFQEQAFLPVDEALR